MKRAMIPFILSNNSALVTSDNAFETKAIAVWHIETHSSSTYDMGQPVTSAQN